MAETKQVSLEIKGDRILIDRNEVSSKTASGIIDTGAKVKFEGTIVAIGTNVKENQIGDVVIFEEYGFVNITVDGKEYVCTKEESIIAKR